MLGQADVALNDLLNAGNSAPSDPASEGLSVTTGGGYHPGAACGPGDSGGLTQGGSFAAPWKERPQDRRSADQRALPDGRRSVNFGSVPEIPAALAEEAGDSLQVQKLELSISDREPLQREALRLAVATAQRKAAELADAAGWFSDPPSWFPIRSFPLPRKFEGPWRPGPQQLRCRSTRGPCRSLHG